MKVRNGCRRKHELRGSGTRRNASRGGSNCRVVRGMIRASSDPAYFFRCRQGGEGRGRQSHHRLVRDINVCSILALSVPRTGHACLQVLVSVMATTYMERAGRPAKRLIPAPCWMSAVATQGLKPWLPATNLPETFLSRPSGRLFSYHSRSIAYFSRSP